MSKISLCTILLVLSAAFLLGREPAPATQSQAHSLPVPANNVHAFNSSVDVVILVDGTPVPFLLDGPYRWIEGKVGERFSFRMYNPHPFPVGVIPSADGQSLTADGRAAADHPAYVIRPYETLTVGLWREDLNGGRTLVFSPVNRSLAAMKGDRRNIGVLGVLVWQLEDRTAARPVPINPGATGGQSKDARIPPASSKDSANSRAGEGLGVGYGGRVDDRAYLTDRYRRVRVLGTVAIYYDDCEGLARAGVLPGCTHPLMDRRHATPFPGTYRGVRIPSEDPR